MLIRCIAGVVLHRLCWPALEAEAQSNGVSVVRLETGIHQEAAIGLYRRNGYVECTPFDDYLEDPLSVFMEKKWPEQNAH